MIIVSPLLLDKGVHVNGLIANALNSRRPAWMADSTYLEELFKIQLEGKHLTSFEEQWHRDEVRQHGNVDHNPAPNR